MHVQTVEASGEGKGKQLLRNIVAEVLGGPEYQYRPKARPPSAEATKVIHLADACTKN